MKIHLFIPKASVTYFDDPANSLDAFYPEVWANEALMVVERDAMMLHLVHRDFENVIAKQGDVVNTRKPASFTPQRKDIDDDVTVQSASATNVQVPLDQLLHTSFIIRDGELSYSFQSLVEMYLVPAMEAIVSGAEQVITGEVYQFQTYLRGKFGTDLTAASLTDMRDVLNGRAPKIGRNLVLTSGQEKNLLDVEKLTTADKIGDDGTALQEGFLGRKYGFNIFESDYMPSVAATDVVTGAVNYASGYAAGTTAITVNGLSAAILPGTWCTIAGDMTPQMITGSTGGATPTAIAITPGLRNAVVHTAVLTMYAPLQANLLAGYAAGYSKAIAVDNATKIPAAGQMVTQGATSAYVPYAVFQGSTPTATSVQLTRGLASTLANDAVLGLGPAGDYGLAFHRNAIAFVSRPLIQVPSDMGVRQAVVSYKGLSLRVSMQYQGRGQGLLVTIDMLCGVKTLDTTLGALLIS